MEKWKVRTIEPAVELTRVGTITSRGFTTVEVKADWIECGQNGILIFWQWKDNAKVKKSAVAVFSAHNLISAIRVEEESDEQTSETTV